MKEKILLLNPCGREKYIRDFYCSFSPRADYYWPPQDLLGLSAILQDEYEVEFLDAMALGLDETACFDKVLKSGASTIVFATGSASFKEDIALAERLKKRENIKIMGCASLFRFIAKDTLEKYPFLDALIHDFTDRDILYYLRQDFSRCRHIAYRRQGNVFLPQEEGDGDFGIGICRQELFIGRASSIPLFPGSPFSIVFTSVGCSLRCKFCVAGKFRLRKRILEEVISELKYIKTLGIKNVFFVDPLFTAEKKRVFEFCDSLGESNVRFDWICNAHACTLQDENMLRAMKASGCKALMIGAESGDEEILKRYNKGADIEQIKNAFALCQRFKIKTLAYFIIGLPGEDEVSIKKTIDLAKEINCDYASFGYATPDIGTELRDECLEKHWIDDSLGQEDFDPSGGPVLRTAQLSQKRVRKMLRQAYRQFYMRPGYILKKIMEERSPENLRALLKGGYSLIRKNIL